MLLGGRTRAITLKNVIQTGRWPYSSALYIHLLNWVEECQLL